MLSSPAGSENPSFARSANGIDRLILPMLAVVLLALPFTWFLPLFRTELLVFLDNEVTVIGAARTLLKADLLLFVVIVLFGMVVPVAKLTGLLCAWALMPRETARAWIGGLNKISKFSMLDIFLIAITIVGLKGVGLGKVEIGYGLYAFAGVVLMILALSFWAQTVATGRADR
ncbi:MAG: paraquat-inducible protein A [Rhizobiales bacterium]|nr:paraquat-inducible protein A [Hyphomicrobiales bacterium]